MDREEAVDVVEALVVVLTSSLLVAQEWAPRDAVQRAQTLVDELHQSGWLDVLRGEEH